MKSRIRQAPLHLVLMLASVVLARVVMVFVVHSPLLTGLLWAALLAGLGLWVLLGEGDSAKAYACVCIVLGVDALIQLAQGRASGAHFVAALCWATWVIGVGLCVWRSAAVRRFHASAGLSDGGE